MKILHLISGGDVGGAKTHIFTLLKELNKSIDVELVCLTEGAFFKDAVKENIPAVLFAQQARFDFSVVKRLETKLNHEGFDILHCHGARANFIGARIKKRMNISIITTVHSDFHKDFEHNFYKKLVFTWVNKHSLNVMDKYLNVSNGMEKVMLEAGYDKSKMYTIYNGIDIHLPTKEYDKNRSKSEIIFGCATRLVPIKGTDVLLKSVYELVKKGYKTKVLIAGHGDEKYTKELLNYVKEHGLTKYVEFLGFVEDMNQFYENIDVNILPSYTEGFPYALLESGTRGIATVATTAGGIVEMIEDDVSGCLFLPGDVQALTEIMSDILMGNINIAKLGQGFRERVVKEFSAKAMAERHIEIYKQIIESL